MSLCQYQSQWPVHANRPRHLIDLTKDTPSYQPVYTTSSGGPNEVPGASDV